MPDLVKNPQTQDREAELLRAAWDEAFKGNRGARKDFAAKHGVHVGFVGRLLNGYDRLNLGWKLRMAAYIGRKPQEIWPDFDLVAELKGDLPLDVVLLIDAALKADPARRAAALLLLAPKPPDEKK